MNKNYQEALQREKRRNQREVDKLCKLTGHPESKIKNWLKKYTAQEILDEVRKYRPHLPKEFTIDPKPEGVKQIVNKRMAERKLEAKAPSTGYQHLDRRIKGFVPGHLYAFTGDTNIGKTSIACNFSYRVGMYGDRRVLYFALEPDNTVVDYLATIASQKKFDDLEAEDYELIPPTIDIYTKGKINSIQEVSETIMDLDRYDLVVIDHIGYFTKETRNTTQVQSNVIKELAGLAKRKKCAIMMIAHLRKGTNSIPEMDDISGSAAFKQDSTDVLIAIRDKNKEDKFGIEYENTGHILVAKTKSGLPGAVPIKFFSGSARIEEIDNYHEAKEAFQ